MIGQKMRRQNSSSTAGREGQRRDQCAGNSQRTDGPETARAAELGEQQTEQSQDHGGRTRGDGLDRSPPGHSHRHPLARVLVQLLAITGDQEQRVVRGRSDDQDRQDSLALTVQPDGVVLGQWVDHHGSDGQPEDRGHQDCDWQDRAPIDHQQDEEHNAQSNEQQDAVDAAERGHEVGQYSPRTGDVDDKPLRRQRLGR